MTQIYARTNEDLTAIVKGLDVNPADYILAVGGSGDQAFALLENAKRVLAVDAEDQQVCHMRQLMEHLQEGDYKGFLEARLGGYDPCIFVNEPDMSDLFKWEMTQGTKYFDKSRLDRIRRKLDVLDIRKENILDVVKSEKGFNKIYLSNAFARGPVTYEDLPLALQIVEQKLPLNGLVYASNGETISEFLDECNLYIDEFLTYLARDEGWHPIVLRKIEGVRK